jgi:hypothetical protein
VRGGRHLLCWVHNNVGISLPSPEDGNRFSFRNAVFSSYLKFRKTDKVYKPNESGENNFLLGVLM